jgi:O-antigen ligase
MVSQRPWWGYGFGAFWTFDSFRENVRQHIGWASQPLIGDNGFLDILLHVGVVGLLIFLIVLVIAFIRSFRYAISHRTLEGFFPLIIMIYAVFANISFSLFAETEVFVWFLIVVVLFMTMDSPGKEPLTDPL